MADQYIKDLAQRVRNVQSPPDSVTVPAATLPSPSYDEARNNTQNLLKTLGYDQTTIQSVVPDSGLAGLYSTMESDALDTLSADYEAARLIQNQKQQELPVDATDQERISHVLRKHPAVHGISQARAWWDRFTEHVGKTAGRAKDTGSLNIDTGLALLDVFTRFDNLSRYGVAKATGALTPEQLAEMRLRYMPTVRLEDPNIKREFHTGTEAALWMIGQRIWGAANTLAGTTFEEASKLLDKMSMPDAAGVLGVLAEQAGEQAADAKSLVSGQIPQLVAGLAPVLSWQTIAEAQWNPEELEDVYQSYDDLGKYGDAAIAAQTIGWAGMDLVGSPLLFFGSIPSKALNLMRATVKRVAPAKNLQILEDIARRTYSSEAAEQAFNASKEITRTAQQAVDEAAAKTGSVPDELYRNLQKAKENELRNELYFYQFQDPGPHEPIMLRTARRSPEYVPDVHELQYEFRVDAPGVSRTKDIIEISDEMARSRARALEAGPPLVHEWDDPQLALGLKEQRLALGPDDTEVAGDALNMLVQGATVDDVTVLPLAPEYYTQPMAATSLSDIRKLNANKKLAQAKKVMSEVDQLELGIPYQMVNRQQQAAKTALFYAKQLGDADEIARLKADLKRISKTKRSLADFADEPYDERWLPKRTPGIMESPERYNNWLQVAGDRVIRSAYPGGLNIKLWHTGAGQTVSPMREPMRYYKTFAPSAWERFRNDLMRFDQALRASNNLITRESLDAGIMFKRSNFNVKTMFSPYQIDKMSDEVLFNVLNVRKSDASFAKLYDELSEPAQRMHDRLRTILDHFADLQGISDTDRYLEGYIRHMWDANSFANGTRSLEMIGLPAKGEVFASHLMKRHGKKGFQRSAILAMDMYMRAAYRKIILEPMYQDIIKTGVEISKRTGNKAHITYANDLVAGLKGTPSFVGAKIDEAVGGAWNRGGGVKLPWRKNKVLWQPGVIDRTAFGIQSLIHNALLSGNPSYAVLQIAAGLSTSAGRYGPLRTLKAVMQMATKEGQQISQASGTYRPFVDFLEMPTMRRINEFFTTKVPAPPFMLTNDRAESISRKITFMAELDLRLNQGGYKTIREARKAGVLQRYLFESMRASEEINHLYGPFGRSPWMMRTFGTAPSGLATQLLSYIPKQTEELMAQFNRNPGAIFQYLAASGWILKQAATAGIDLSRAVGLGFVPQSAREITSPAVDAAMTNLELMEAMNDGDPAAVERASEKLAKLLPLLIPTSQLGLKTGRMAQRLELGTIMQGEEPLSRMQFFRKEGEKAEGIGGELLPTFLMQQNLRETLVRRATDESRKEDRRFAANAARFVDDYVDLLEAGRYDEAAELSNELENVYKIRLESTDPIDRALEARSISQVFRSIEGQGKTADIWYENFRRYGINIAP